MRTRQGRLALQLGIIAHIPDASVCMYTYTASESDHACVCVCVRACTFVYLRTLTHEGADRPPQRRARRAIGSAATAHSAQTSVAGIAASLAPVDPFQLTGYGACI